MKSETRQKILRSARRLFSEKGYRGTPTAQIARDAGVSEVTLYRHFNSKKELFNECIQLPLDEMLNMDMSRITEANTLEEFVEAVLEFRMKIYEEHYEVFRIMFKEFPYSEEAVTYLMGFIKGQESSLGQLMSKMKGLGEIKRKRNSFVFSLGIRMAIWAYLNFKKLEEKDDIDLSLSGQDTEIEEEDVISEEHLISDLAEYYLYGIAGIPPHREADKN